MMLSKVKYFIIVAIVLSNPAKGKECGQRPYTVLPLILGGENAVSGEWPWHAAIYILDNEESNPSYQCGGTLISSSFVLTAAHCTLKKIIPLPANLFRLRLGSIILNSTDQQDYGVNLVVRHFKYDPWKDQYDVALLKAASKITFSNFVQPVCVPTDGGPFSLGTVVGWGISDKHQVETILQKADLNVVDYVTCLKSSPYLFSVLQSNDSSNYCAGNSNRINVCFGDSGGGMFTYSDVDNSWYIRGITNAGVRIEPYAIKQCDPKKHVTFANVKYYSDWIQSVQATESNNLLDLQDCGTDDHDDSVLENDKPIFQQYPWVAILEYDFNYSSELMTVCGGVLIHPRFVLATGHCVCEGCRNFKLKAVRLGDFDLSTNPDQDPDGENIVAISIPIAKIILHPEFELPDYGHNIAIIKLATVAPTQMTNVKPICLPNARIYSESHFIVGWKRAGKSKELHREQVEHQDVKQCIQLYKLIDIDLEPEDSVLCVKGLRKSDDCFSFKSGSPMHFHQSIKGTNQYYLKGLFMFGLAVCGQNPNHVSIDTGYYLNWIKQTVEKEIL